MSTLTPNPVKRSAPSPTGRTPEAKRNAEKPEDNISSNMGDNTDPRPNTGPLQGNTPPQDTGTSTSTSPKSTGAGRSGADNRSRRSPTHSPTRSGRGRGKKPAGKDNEVHTNSASRSSRYDAYTTSGNRGQSSTRSRSRHAKWQTVSRKKGTNYSAKHRYRDIEADNSTRVPPNEGLPGHEADEDCKCFNCHAKKFPKANERTPPYRLRGEKYLGAKKQPDELTPELFYSLPLGKQVWLRQKFRWLTQDIPENPSGNSGQSMISPSLIGPEGSTGPSTSKQGNNTPFADAAKRSRTDQIMGDLPMKVIRDLLNNSQDKEGVVPLYIQTSHDERRYITEDDFKFVFLRLQDMYIRALELDSTLQVNMANYRFMNGHGVLLASNQRSADWYRTATLAISRDGKLFRAWKTGEVSTTLVTIIVKDNGYTPNENLIPLIRACNRIPDHCQFHQMKVKTYQTNDTRKITFGAKGELLDLLHDLKTSPGYINFTGLKCDFTISKPRRIDSGSAQGAGPFAGTSGGHAHSTPKSTPEPPQETMEPELEGTEEVPKEPTSEGLMETDSATEDELTAPGSAEEHELLKDDDENEDDEADSTLKETRSQIEHQSDESDWADEVEKEDIKNKALAISAKMINRFNDWSKTRKGEKPKTLTVGEITEALRNGQIFDQFE